MKRPEDDEKSYLAALKKVLLGRKRHAYLLGIQNLYDRGGPAPYFVLPNGIAGRSWTKDQAQKAHNRKSSASPTKSSSQYRYIKVARASQEVTGGTIKITGWALSGPHLHYMTGPKCYGRHFRPYPVRVWISVDNVAAFQLIPIQP